MNRAEPDRRRSTRGLALLAALAIPILSAPTGDPLREGFLHPPPEARMRCYWWWLNGNTTEAAITRDLEEMRAKGYGGALLVDADGSSQHENRPAPAGPEFGSPRWRTLYKHALREAGRLGLELSLNIQSGWNLGGPMVTPDEGAKLLVWSRIAVDGPADLRRALPQPNAAHGGYRDIAVLAYPLRHGAALPGERQPIRQLAIKSAAAELGMSMPPTEALLEDYPAVPGEEDASPADVRDVTSSLGADGEFHWQAPAGNWEILRVGYAAAGAKVPTSSNTWQGLAIDYLDRRELETYWRQAVEPRLEDARPYIGRSLRYLVTDSWELGGLNWTGRFRDEFRQRRGYDVLPYLPVIAGRILWKKPFRTALGAAAHPGWNELEIAVTNLWPNRLIGDQRLPAEQRLTRTNITKFTTDSALLPSGLLGPVAVEATETVRLH